MCFKNGLRVIGLEFFCGEIPSSSGEGCCVPFTDVTSTHGGVEKTEIKMSEVPVK
jgi:hypothetical protein